MCILDYRFQEVISHQMENYETFVMDLFSNLIHCSMKNRVLSRSICITMTWKYATLWVQRQLFMNLVRFNFFIIGIGGTHFTPHMTIIHCFAHPFFNLCIGVFYYTLGNLHSSLRSTLHSIQLVAITKTKFVKEYGIDEILTPFMNDICRLEQVYCTVEYELTFHA